MSEGIVYLIGAGPGDPGLITVKGRHLIQTCDVVVYDYLANPKLLSLARKDAEIIYVGKMGGAHTMSQENINALIVEKCSHGKSVARLKGGDPFIFGRGGEEAEELVKAGLKFEVVPGVTAATAASAYAGIPLTHRDYTATVAFVTGHEDPTKDESNIHWDKIATGIGTLVFFMGIKNLPLIVSNLVKNGRSKDTPVAVIRWGTMPDQKTVVGTLADIAERVEKAGIKPPAITVVGEVVNLKPTLDWFEKRPLFGRRIVVTRAREQASSFADRLAGAGAEVIEFPTIETVKPQSWESLDRELARLDTYDWIIFTSVNGVKYFVDRLKETGSDIRALKGVKIQAIGPKTAEAIENMGVRVDAVPSEYRAEAIVASLGAEGVTGKNIFIPRAKVAREVLPDELRKMGANVVVAEAYETVIPDGKRDEMKKLFEEGKVDVVTFTSSSTVSNFVEMFGKEETLKLLDGVKVASIGPITSETARKFGLNPVIEPSDYTTEALAQGIEKLYAGG
jgi:uroporphyrinogen III methyltransferase/synthase